MTENSLCALTSSPVRLRPASHLHTVMTADIDGALKPLWKQDACVEPASRCRSGCSSSLQSMFQRVYHSKTRSFELRHIYTADVI